MHSVWLIDVRGDPVYTACKVCSTKIDPMTGKCKKTDDGCATEAAEAPRVLATVHLADWTGQLSNVLVGGPELALLAPGQPPPVQRSELSKRENRHSRSNRIRGRRHKVARRIRGGLAITARQRRAGAAPVAPRQGHSRTLL